MGHIQLNYAFLLFWSSFGLIHWKLLFLVKQVTISERSTEILRELVYLNKFEKRQIQRKIWIVVNNLFVQSSKMGQILTKTVFLLKMSHMLLNYAFLLFWSSFGLISSKLLFLERSTEILRELVYLNKFEKRQIQRKIWIVVNNLFVQSSKMGQILTKTVFLLKMSHMLLNYAFLLFWSSFGLISSKLLFLVKKVTISERSTEILRKFVYRNKFEKGQIQRRIWICWKQPFLYKAVKWDKY